MTDIEKLEDIPEENEDVAKTPNLQLHDWIGTDVVVREEFVEDNKKIDEFAGDTNVAIENLENEKLNIIVFNKFKETIESEIGDLDDRFGIELTQIEDADAALKTGMYSINTKVNTPYDKDGVILVYAINKNDIVQEFIVSNNHTETYRRRFTGTFDNWTRTGITSKEAREDSNESLIVHKSNVIPPVVEGGIYLNTKDNFFYAGKDGQWYRLFLAGESKVEQKAPTVAPKLSSKTDTTVTLSSDNTMEFRYIGGNWQTSTLFTGLSRNKAYNFQSRYKETDVYKASGPSPSLSVTTDKGTQSAPPSPTVTNIKHDRATVSGGNMVRLSNSNTWYTSPHTFTGLSEETSYTAYAKYKETETHKESPTSSRVFRTLKDAWLYGFEVDENNLNPRTAVTYIGSNASYTPMKVSNYGSWEELVKDISTPVLLKAGKVQYELQHNNFTKRKDGSNSILTGADGDVMIRFKHLWVKEEKVSSTKRRVWLSEKSFDGATSYTKMTEKGYNQLSWGILMTLQHLYLLLYKDRDSQTALGRGYVDGNDNFASTGGTNTKPYFFGETTGKQQMKFCGIESFWDNKFNWVDGIVSDSNYDLKIGYTNFNDSGSGYKLIKTPMTSNVYGYFKSTMGGEAGYILTDKAGSSSTGYCDDGDVSAGKIARFGGSSSDGDDAGAFDVRLLYSASFSYSGFGARLCFVDDDYFYVGAYTGYVEGSKLRSISGKAPTGSETIGKFRTYAQNNN